MKYALGNMLNGAGGLNPDGLSLDLQFAADKTLTARKGPTPVFTRASTATFIGSNGLIQSAAINAARFDHDPVTLACKGLLIEESRTNLCLQSNAFSTSPWGNINTVCAITQNETGVDGIANSAWTFTDDSVLNSEGRFITATLTSGVACSYSIFVKKTTGTPSTYPAIWLARSGTFGGCVINTTAGTATPITAFGAGTIISTTASVVDFGNFWRVTSFVTPTATGSWEISISPSGNGTGTGVIDGTTTGSAVFWGAQVETGSFPTSYIPTTTASLARSADVCNITAGAFSGFWNQSEGTLLSQTQKASTNANAFIISASDGSFNNETDLRYNSVSQVAALINVSNISQLSGLQANITSGAAVKSSIAYKLNDCAYVANGASPILDTSALIPTLDRLTIGNVAVAGNNFYLNGHITSFRYFRKRLSNAKLQTLTA